MIWNFYLKTGSLTNNITLPLEAHQTFEFLFHHHNNRWCNSSLYVILHFFFEWRDVTWVSSVCNKALKSDNYFGDLIILAICHLPISILSGVVNLCKASLQHLIWLKLYIYYVIRCCCINTDQLSGSFPISFTFTENFIIFNCLTCYFERSFLLFIFNHVIFS